MLEIKNLSKSFHENKVLDHINLKIEKGDVVGIIGPSGTGKSILIKDVSTSWRSRRRGRLFLVEKRSIFPRNTKTAWNSVRARAWCSRDFICLRKRQRWKMLWKVLWLFRKRAKRMQKQLL